MVKGRPDLKVRTRRRYFELKTDQTVKTASSSTTSPEDDLKTALGSLYPRPDVPTYVSAKIDSGTKGQLLTLSMKIDHGMLAFDGTSGKETALVDVLGAAIDDRGVCSTFRQKLEIPREALSGNDRFVKWTQLLRLPQGLYQVRVAVRDRQSGRTGSAMTWIEIPR
jgi:hypothetical protein